MKISVIIAVFVCCCVNISHANNPGKPFNTADNILEQRIQMIDAQVDLRFSDLTRKKIIEYTTYKKGAEKLLQKAQVYFPLFEKELIKHNIPQEFKYLPVIESNLRVNIRSRAGAVGLWQFMKATGQSFGLKIGAEVDERMDPEKATKAAAQYLLQLYNEFNDWTLVLAAYNSGAGNIRKAMRKSGGKSYWEIYDYLPRETRSYLPKFVAAAYLMNFHNDHDIYRYAPDQNMTNTMSARIFDEIDFATIANSSEADIELIEVLNSEFFKGFIPKSDGEYVLTLPVENMSKFLANNYSAELIASSLPANMRRNNIFIAKIDSAIKLQLDVQQANKVVARHLNKITTRLKPYRLYKLDRQETLEEIAERENLLLSELLDINNLDADNLTRLPKALKLPQEISQ